MGSASITEARGTGPPLLFLHGLGGDMEQSAEMLRPLGNVRKIFMDVRGHGKTEPVGPEERLTFDQFAGDAKALLDDLGIESCLVGGISMGSGIAAAMALSFPEAVGGLILVRPAWLDRRMPENLKEHVLIGKLLEKHSVEEARRLFAESKEYRHLQETAPACASSLMGQFDAPEAKQCASRLTRIPDSTPFANLADLATLRCKTLVLGTDRDPVHPLDMARQYAEAIPASLFATVCSKSEDKDRHLSECAAAITEFVEEYRSASGRASAM